jgi:hypothetical protein
LQANQVNKQNCRLKKIQPKLTSCAIFEGYKPTNAIRLQSYYANLAIPVNFGRSVCISATRPE